MTFAFGRSGALGALTCAALGEPGNASSVLERGLGRCGCVFLGAPEGEVRASVLISGAAGGGGGDWVRRALRRAWGSDGSASRRKETSPLRTSLGISGASGNKELT